MFSRFVTRPGTFLFADDGVHGREIWVVDATIPIRPSLQLIDIVPGGSDVAPSQHTMLGSKLFFSTAMPTRGTEIAVLDLHTQTPTFFDLTPGATGSNPTDLTFVGNKLFLPPIPNMGTN